MKAAYPSISLHSLPLQLLTADPPSMPFLTGMHVTLAPLTTRHTHEQTSAHSWLPSLATMGEKSLPCTSQALRGGEASVLL